MASSSAAMFTLTDYFATEETNHPQELRWGTVVREPAAPGYRHQRIVVRLVMRLERHVRERGLGEILASPIDVVLDEARALVLQPDVVYLSNVARLIQRDRVWGAPDLVVEVLSDSTKRGDSGQKADWYRDYGVTECWLVDPVSRSVDVAGRTFAGRERIRSAVLPALRLVADSIFEDGLAGVIRRT